MAGKKWTPFPYAKDDYIYTGEAFQTAWEALHAGDLEPFPDANYLAELGKSYPEALASISGFEDDLAALTEQLRIAWQCFHRGDFQQARESALVCGTFGYNLANKSTIVYADHLEENEARRRKLYEAAAERSEEAIAAMPEVANGYYFHASALGRYSQSISIVKALAQGLGGKIKESLDSTLQLEPEHPEAHLALGLYHAEIVDKVGAMVGKLTYGASKEAGREHLETALELAPGSPLIQMEYANGLLMMYGDKILDEATQAYIRASEIEPLDAMQRLDVEAAESELE